MTNSRTLDSPGTNGFIHSLEDPGLTLALDFVLVDFCTCFSWP